MVVQPVRTSPDRDRAQFAWAPLAVATAALAALVALVAGRTADPFAAGAAGALVLAVGGSLTLWLRMRGRTAAAVGPSGRGTRTCPARPPPRATSPQCWRRSRTRCCW